MQDIKSITVVTSAGVKVYALDETVARINVASLYFHGDPYDHYCGVAKNGDMVFSINCLVPCVVEYEPAQP